MKNDVIRANKDNDNKYFSGDMSRMMAESVQRVSPKVYATLEEAGKTVTTEEVELFSE